MPLMDDIRRKETICPDYRFDRRSVDPAGKKDAADRRARAVGYHGHLRPAWQLTLVGFAAQLRDGLVQVAEPVQPPAG
jgi:hypothetical protein